MFDYLQAREAAAKRAVDELDEAEVVEGDHPALVEALFETTSIQPVELLWNDMYQDAPREANIVTRDAVFNEVFTGRGTELTVHLPFTGDAELFAVAPTRGNFNPPRGSVRGREVVLDWQGRFAEPAQVKAWLNGLRGQLEAYATWSKEDCQGFNNVLRGRLEGWLRERKAHLEKNTALASALEVPVGKKPSPSTVLVPVRKRRPITIRQTSPGGKAAQEFAISDEDYAAIVDQLTSARSLLERLPETFSPMGEEALRDILLVILNNQLGPAGAEIFSRKGKTDIAILREKGAVFIAECKNWSGEKAFGEAIEQLLGYLVWRDTKAALLCFVREKNVTAISEKALAELAGHRRHVRAGSPIGDVPTEILHHEGDERRHIRVALVIIPIPPVT
jgi:hypothetical protein